MRRLVILLLVILLLIIIAGLSRTALDPEVFRGEWYSADDQNVYLFQEGLIYCSRSSDALTDADSISGAYTYSRDSIFLFVEGVPGLETEQEIYLVQNHDGRFLCENKDGTGMIYFIQCNE